jgi:hypothetical protein
MAEALRKPAAKARKPRPIPMRVLRFEMEEAIDRIIDILDLLDSDPDLEPSLGAPEKTGAQTHWAEGDRQDREEQAEDDDPEELRRRTGAAPRVDRRRGLRRNARSRGSPPLKAGGRR